MDLCSFIFRGAFFIAHGIDRNTEHQLPQKKHLLHGYLAALATLLMWSGFSLISRMGGKSILTPYDIFALRLATASLVLLPFIGSMPKNAWRDGRLWLVKRKPACGSFFAKYHAAVCSLQPDPGSCGQASKASPLAHHATGLDPPEGMRRAQGFGSFGRGVAAGVKPEMGAARA